MINLIVAIADNNLIGSNQSQRNSIPWHISKDMKHFKKLTMGSTLIMGRKTAESIGKPLAGRNSIVISRKQKLENYSIVVDSLKRAINAVSNKDKENIFIIGGAEIYKIALESKVVDKMYITRIYKNFNNLGDVYFPEYETKNWKIISEQKEEENNISFSFLEYIKK